MRLRRPGRWGACAPAAILAAALFLALTIAACGGGEKLATPTPTATPRPGGTFAYPLLGDPVSIEPLNAQEPGGLQVAHQVFQGLTRYQLDGDGRLQTVPCIAEKWESNDARTWVFHLRKGVMFQAPVGREVVAQDFVDSWDRVTDPINDSAVSYLLAPLQGCDADGRQTDPAAGLTGVRAIDPYTLEVKLRYPFAELPAVLANPVAAVTPVDYIDKVGHKAYAQRPVGTGPFKVAAWKHGRAITLVKDPGYWDAGHAAWVDEVDLRVFDDVPAMWQAFADGRLDSSQVPAGEAAGVAGSGKVASGRWSAVAWPQLAIAFVGINMIDPTLGGDAELRAAVARSTNSAAVIRAAGEGVPAALGGYVPPGVPGGGSGQAPMTYDPAGALAAVQAMSSVPRLDYWYAAGADGDAVAGILKNGWKAGGIAVRPRGYEWSVLYGKLAGGASGAGSSSRSQLFSSSFIAAYPSAYDFLYQLFSSDASAKGSFTSYSNPEVDGLLAQARGTLDDGDRYGLYAQAEKLILADMPAVPLYSYRAYRVTDTRIAGFVQDPMGLTDMSALWVQ